MYEEILRERLSTLYSDLTCTNTEAVALVNLMNDSIDDKTNMIKDVYFRDRAPVKVLSTVFSGSGGTYDIENEIIEVGEGYDRFIRRLGYKTSCVLNRHFMALSLFLEILALPDPYSKILYLHYYKCLTITEVSETLFISKSACHRHEQKGIRILHKNIEKKYNK
jgi:hypothetical protein